MPTAVSGDMGAGRTGESEPGVAPSGGDHPVSVLTDILVASLDSLARAGQADAACRQAGKACAALRVSDPVQWRKFNALLHRMRRLVPSGDS